MSTPTATMRQLLNRGWSNADIDEIEARVEAVFSLHSRVMSSGACAECLGEAPCATVRALNGQP